MRAEGPGRRLRALDRTTKEAKWRFIYDGLSRFAGRALPLNEEVYASALETNFRNQSITLLLKASGESTPTRRKQPTCTPSSVR
jgi:glutaminase